MPTARTPAKRYLELTAMCLLLALGLVAITMRMTANLGKIASNPDPVPTPDPTASRDELLAGAHKGMGSATARYSLVEFADMQCPVSSGGRSEIERAYLAHRSELRVVTLHFKTSPLHTRARILGTAIEAAALQGKDWQLGNLFLSNIGAMKNSARPESTRDIDAMASRVGMDMPRFRRDMQNPALARCFDRDIALAERLKLSQQPSYFFLRPTGAPLRIATYGSLVHWLAAPEKWPGG